MISLHSGHLTAIFFGPARGCTCCATIVIAISFLHHVTNYYGPLYTNLFHTPAAQATDDRHSRNVPAEDRTSTDETPSAAHHRLCTDTALDSPAVHAENSSENFSLLHLL